MLRAALRRSLAIRWVWACTGCVARSAAEDGGWRMEDGELPWPPVSRDWKSKQTSKTFDFVIVGGGTAGSVLAHRLSHSLPHLSLLLLLEAGLDQRSDDLISHPRLERQTTRQPHPTTGISLHRPSARTGRGKGNGLPVVDPPHANGGNHGPIQASLPQGGNVLGPAWLEACRSLGLEILKDPLEGEVVGGYISTCHVTGTTRERSHAGVAYLGEETLGRVNLKVVTGVLVDKIQLEKGADDTEATATGVTYWQDNSLHNAQVRKEVLLAAGVFGSPAILERSGIGSRTLLSKYNIPIIHPNDHVGENLQDHIRVGLSFEGMPDYNPEKNPLQTTKLANYTKPTAPAPGQTTPAPPSATSLSSPSSLTSLQNRNRPPSPSNLRPEHEQLPPHHPPFPHLRQRNSLPLPQTRFPPPSTEKAHLNLHHASPPPLLRQRAHHLPFP
ncbi:uncharacterized protein MYCGRDRAFT_93436 [Zymoseptoria tritici IPO323]|uniref:Glucose-methanol-choline oxidoreductase N-terminal domain-containing protein n=1 Tax=Zymoseptoria tritici (strain CBS 115943 / IPO323) TaxID=336722 RepID=F9XBV6_ZYMTI|nr:uncharacterized protein MYCGRDRAFT_93436 [Zymoseptoria tritici IPO323]EGP87477.1 hypothetical protein MYCGRDRAFT_93436 [Zymoseptoria tritici IPO323]